MAESVTDRMVEVALHVWMGGKENVAVAMRAAIEAALRERALQALADSGQEIEAVMSDQPEALRLAEMLEAYGHCDDLEVAAELRRLHGEVESMRAERLHSERQTKALRKAARMALESLDLADALILHQFNGTRPAMDAMHRAAQACGPAMKALREALA